VSTGTAPEAITRDELADALAALRITPEDENTFYPAVADAIFMKVRRSREPGYEPGEMYRDADGGFWLYQPERNYACSGSWADCPWLKPGDGAAYSLNSPKLPLRRLVPEHAHPDSAAILAGIIAWTSESNQYKVLAERICKLLEGSDD
jgi:hypothetical protein